MANKKLFSRKQFEKFLAQQGQAMASDSMLAKKSLAVLERAAEYHWIHQTKWFGEPILNPAQDMFARQEIIFNTRPDYIIEVGVAWGGSLLFYSTLMEMLGGKKIIGIDIFIPNDLKKRLFSHTHLAKRLELITASSTEPSTIDHIRSIIGKSKKVLVILDSNHTHEHVLKELRMYAPLVGKGQYLICDDTFVEQLKPNSVINTNRPWGKGNNPETALRKFLKENKQFAIDKSIGNKLLISCNPDGYLKRIKG